MGGALLGGLILAVFWKRGRGTPVVGAMLFSLGCMTLIQLLPKLSWSKDFWMRYVGTEIFWPWYTLIGVVITLAAAFVLRKVLPANAPATSDNKQA